MDGCNSLFKRCIPLAFIVALGAGGPVQAVHDNSLFELDVRAGVAGDQDRKNDPIPPFVGDGNVADEGATGDDWETIYADFDDGTPAGDNSGAFVLSFIEDTFANSNIDNGAEAFVALRTPENSFYTGGGSKDTNGIQSGPWKYKIVSDQVPDKNDIVNAFAAAYTGGTGQDPNDVIFYFGLDTYSVNGDSNAGFWFFRGQVGLAPLGPGEDTGFFTGEHQDGDIFVAVAYTEGGDVGDIDVYRWDGDDATGSLVLQESGQDCATVGADDEVCGVINKLLPDDTFGEDPVFDYANTLVSNNPLDATSYQYESAAFVEFGLNISKLLGDEIGCFSTFLAESRSSQSETAQLKDFALGVFPLCSAEAETEIHAGSNAGGTPHTVIALNSSTTVVGDTIHDSVLVTGNILGGLSLPDPTGDVQFLLFNNIDCDPAVDGDGDGYPGTGFAGDPSTDANVLSASKVSLSGNGDGTASAESANYTVTGVGGHCYRAWYLGDDNYTAISVSPKEPFNTIQPKINVRKEIISCAVDPGEFDFSIYPSADPNDVVATVSDLGDPNSPVNNLTNGETLAQSIGVPPGTYTVEESTQSAYVVVYDAATATDCNDPGNDDKQSITLGGNDNKTCAFLNVRKPRVTVNKVVVNATGSEAFDLSVGATMVVDNGANGASGSTLISTLAGGNFGTPSVGEVGDNGTKTGDYSTVIQCDDGTSGAWDLSPGTNNARSVTISTLQPGDHVTCTITNIAPTGAKACLSSSP